MLAASQMTGHLRDMIDLLGRRITYLRFSVTDRCDLRCLYCLGDEVEFLPKPQTLNLEEIDRLCAAFIRLGVRKLRLTGGEPLVRRGIMGLLENLGRHVAAGALDELTLTTNGTQLARFADGLRAAGMRRINVSLDTLSPATFRRITARGDLGRIIDGILAARQAGLAVKINMVALNGINDGEIDGMIRWCGGLGFDLSLIETMPLGDVGGTRTHLYLPLDEVRRRLQTRWTLLPCDYRSGGPARYVTVAETGRRLGFITPMSHEFCAGCNRVRVTSDGRLYPCLGREQAVDLRPLIRGQESDRHLEDHIAAAIAAKPPGHLFTFDPQGGGPILERTMNRTGG